MYLNLGGVIGLVVLLAVLVVTVAAPWLAEHDPLRQNLRARLSPPAWDPGGRPEHLLGTDQLGRDILSRILYGSRVTLLVSLSASVLAGLIGSLLGLLSGYYGGRLDSILMRIVDIQHAMPTMIMAIALMAYLPPGIPNLILVLVLWSWPSFARLMRGNVLSVKENEFVVAARALGASDVQILWRHVFPHTLSSLTVLWSFTLAYLIVVESSLSFLGVGVPPPNPSLGRMLSEAREVFVRAPWLYVYPGGMIALTVLAVNMLGDWLRDRLDPHGRA